MSCEGSEVTLNLKEAWLARTIVYSSGEEEWVFKTSKPGYEEEYHAELREHKPSQLKRIMYVEVTA